MGGNDDKKFKKMPIGKAEKWLVDNMRDIGIDIEGFEHEITNDFVDHAMKRHRDEEKERENGQIPLTIADFEKLPEVVVKPDLTIVGAKRGARNIIAYAKKFDDGTSVYFEEILDSKNNKALRGKTMYNRKGALGEVKFRNIVSDSGKTDLSNAKIIAGAGSHPSGAASDNAHSTVADPVVPHNNTPS